MSERPAWRSLRVIALVAALLVAVIWYLRPLRTASDVDARASSEAAAALAEAELTPAEPAPVFHPEPSERAPVQDPEWADTVGADGTPLALARPDTRVFEGSLVVVGTKGAEIAPQNAHFILIAWSGSTGWNYPATIERGRWRVLVDHASSVDGVSITNFQGESPLVTLVAPLERVPWPQANWLELRGHAADRSMLTVIDAESRARLSDVTLVRDSDHSFTTVVHPGNAFGDRAIGRALASPIDIDALLVLVDRKFPLSLLVGAPGFAWKRVDIELSAGGEREIELDRGGELVVTTSGPDPGEAAELRLYGSQPMIPICSVPLVVHAPTSFAGLPPGDYTVRAELGEWYRNALVLGAANARVEAGLTSSAVLPIREVPRFARFDVSGCVLVPDAWINFKELTLGITLERKDEAVPGFEPDLAGFANRAEPRRAGYTTFEWKIADVPAGTYELQVSRPQVQTTIEVRAGGANDFELVAPPPFALQVIAVDAATGLDIEDPKVSWALALDEGMYFTSGSMRSHPSGRGLLIEVPTTTIFVSVGTDDHIPAGVELDLVAAPTPTYVARLQRAHGAVLSMRIGEVNVPFPFQWDGTWQHADNAGRVESLINSRSTFRVTVDTPGTYWFDFPKLDGYHAVPTQKVEIPVGKYVEHVVQLERETP